MRSRCQQGWFLLSPFSCACIWWPSSPWISTWSSLCVHECLVGRLCLTLCNPVDCHPPGSFVHGISQARILERVAIFFSRGSSWSRDWNHVSYISCIAGGFFTLWAINLPVSKFPFLISIPVTALGPTLMSWCMRLHGLYPTRLLCPWRFSRQEYWSGLPCPSPGGSSPLRDQTQVSCIWSIAEDSLPLSHWGKLHFTLITSLKTQFPNRVIFWGSRY